MQVSSQWEIDRVELHAIDGRRPYPYLDQELRKVARDAFVDWRGSRYSVPWSYAGKQVWVREKDSGLVEVHYGDRRIAEHAQAPGRHRIVRNAEHHAGIPLGARQPNKTLVFIKQTAPVVQTRPPSAYEFAAAGGGQ
jgi:hypothetical protein